MAQVLLDQKNSRRRLKNMFYGSSKSFNTISNRKSIHIKQRKKRPNKFFKKIQSSTSDVNLLQYAEDDETIDDINFDCYQVCDSSVSKADLQKDTEIKSKNKLHKLKCSVCGYLASCSQRLKEHSSRHSGSKHLECEVCGKKFAWRYSYKSHLAFHKNDSANTCSVCGKKYCTKASLKNHILRTHNSPKKEHKCIVCGKEYLTKSELQRHSINHSNVKTFVCEYCGNAYHTKNALTVHYRFHTGEKPYKCEFCEKSFMYLSSAIGHRRRHTGENPFQCPTCGKLFSVKRAMTAHLSVHSENKTFKCNECGKGFKSRSGYRVHLDFHLGLKRHKCRYCDKTFRAWGNMQKHMKRHLVQKQHKCDSCEKSFILKADLENHIKSHFNLNKECAKGPTVAETSINSCNEIINSHNLACATNIGSSNEFNEHHPENMISSDIDIPDNQAELYDCNISNSVDKCQAEKCQILSDNYVSQYLYPQTPTVQYNQQNIPILNMYVSNEAGPSPIRSTCISNLNSTFNCISVSNQSYNNFSCNIPNSDGILSKCKLCHCLFHSTLVLRNHLLDYHRIDEEHISEILN